MQHSEIYDGLELTVTMDQSEAGGWQSKAEVDLGKTGRVVFQNQDATYPSAEEAKLAAIALVAKNLGRSRIGRPNAI